MERKDEIVKERAELFNALERARERREELVGAIRYHNQMAEAMKQEKISLDRQTNLITDKVFSLGDELRKLK